MGTTSTKKAGFYLTPSSIESHLKMGKRRHMAELCKGLELEVLKSGRAQFRYYFKDRSGPKPVDRRVPLAYYDKSDPKCLAVVYALWEQAHEVRKKGLPVVLEMPPEAVAPAVSRQAYRVTLGQALEEYLTHLAEQVLLRNLSRKTVAPWGAIMRRFERVHGGKALAAMSVEFLQDYLNGLVLEAVADGGDGRSTRMNTRACLVNFFQWALSKKLVQENVAQQTSRAEYEYDQSVPEVEDFSRYLAALRKVTTAGEARLSVSHYLWLLALTGCRRDELALATIGDFYLSERKRLIVASKAKDGKNHWTGISHMAEQVVRAQIELLKLKGLSTHRTSPLFPAKAALKTVFPCWHRDDLKPMSSHVIYKHHHSLALAAGIESFTIHDFRRVFVTMSAALGVSPDLQRRLVSHTTGRRDANSKNYDKHDYLPELRESASRIAVVIDFLAAGPVDVGRRLPRYCGKDFLDSFGYWYSENGRKFVNDAPYKFDVAALVKTSLVALNARDKECGYSTGEALADAEIKQMQSQPSAQVKSFGHAIGATLSGVDLEDGENLPLGSSVTNESEL